MKRTCWLILSLLLAGIVVAQLISVAIRIGGKSWSFNLLPSVATLTCDKTGLAKGESSVCTVTLDAAAPTGGYTTPVSVDLPLTAPATATVAAGQTTATVVVTRPS